VGVAEPHGRENEPRNTPKARRTVAPTGVACSIQCQRDLFRFGRGAEEVVGATESRERLLAVLAADAAGYSRLLAMDRYATVAALEAARDVFRRHVQAGGGRVVDTAGDSVLAVFETASSAAACALAVQLDLADLAPTRADGEALRFRIGIHLSDVIERADGTVYGDGVNVAARLQQLAEPGGIVISEAIRSLIGTRSRAIIEDLGVHSFKNICAPVAAYRLTSHAETSQTPAVQPSSEKPSIAVLPFVNRSADPDSHHFSDGLSEELINALAQLPNLRVIARTSSFAFKGKAMQVRDIAKALGVENVLEGSVRKSGTRIRVTAQLVRAGDDAHLWSETYDRQLDDIFVVQDDVVKEVLGALVPKLSGTPVLPTASAGTRDVSALELVFRGNYLLHHGGDERSLRLALEAFERAIAQDPGYARAHCLFAQALLRLSDAGGLSIDAALPRAEQALSLALDAAPGFGHALALRGNFLFHYGQDVAGASTVYERAVRCAPGEAAVQVEWSHFLASCGRVQEALQAAELAVGLDPYTPETRVNLARVLMAGRQFTRAEEIARKVVAATGRGRAVLGRCLVAMGRSEEALECVAALRVDLARICVQALAFASEGRAAEARSAMCEMQERFGDGVSYQLAQVLSLLGCRDDAITMLERARATRDGGLMGFVLIDSFVDSLRAEPRFVALLHDLGLARTE